MYDRMELFFFFFELGRGLTVAQIARGRATARFQSCTMRYPFSLLSTVASYSRHMLCKLSRNSEGPGASLHAVTAVNPLGPSSVS